MSSRGENAPNEAAAALGAEERPVGGPGPDGDATVLLGSARDSAGSAPAFIELGPLALGSGFVRGEQLEGCLEDQRAARREGRAVPGLGELMVRRGFLTRAQLDALLEMQSVLNRPAPDARPRGTSLGKFRLLRELGRGSAGVVYEAMDGILERRVALKTSARRAEGGDEAGEERLLREARTLARIPPHPHIVQIHEAGRLEGAPYLAMELIDGDHLLRQERLSQAEQVRLLRDAALAVHHAHLHGVVHRDLKPSNILVDAELRPHVTDFGLAKAPLEPSPSSSDAIVGTPQYMSPEQARGLRDIGPASDLYSLGVILYVILVGRVPFPEGGLISTLRRVLSDTPLPPSMAPRAAGRGDVDPRLETTCLRAMSRDPRARHADVLAFARELSAWLGRSADIPRA